MIEVMEKTISTGDIEPNALRSIQDEKKRKLYKFDAISDMSKTRRLYLGYLVKKLTKNYARHRRMELGDIDTDLATAVLSCARSLEMTVAHSSLQEVYQENLTELLNQIDSKTQNRTLYEELMVHINKQNLQDEHQPTPIRRHSYNNEDCSKLKSIKRQRMSSFHGKELSLKKSAPLAIVSIDPDCRRNPSPDKRQQSTQSNISTYSQSNVLTNTKDPITNLPLPVPPPTLNNNVCNSVPDMPVSSNINSFMSNEIPLKAPSRGTEVMNNALQESNMWSGHGWENIQPWVNYMYANQYMTINIPFTMSPHAYKDTQYGDGNFSDELKSKVFLPPPPPPTNFNINNLKAECQNNDSMKISAFIKKGLPHSSDRRRSSIRENEYAELLKTAFCSPDHWETVEEWLNHSHYFPKPVKPSVSKRKNIPPKQKDNIQNMHPKSIRKRLYDAGNMPQTFQHLKSRYKSRQPLSKSFRTSEAIDIVHRPQTNSSLLQEQLKDKSAIRNAQSIAGTLHRKNPSVTSREFPAHFSQPTHSPDPPWYNDISKVTLSPNENTKLAVPKPASELLDVKSLLGKPINFGEDNDTIMKGLEDMFQSDDEPEKKSSVDRVNSNTCNDIDLLRDLEDDDIYELTKCLEEGLEPTDSLKVEKDITLEDNATNNNVKKEPNCGDIENQNTFEQKLNKFSTLCDNISEGADHNAFAVKPVSVPTIWPCEAHYQRLLLCQEMDKICDENWKKYNKIKIKFGKLFGDNSEDELAPQSPIEETRAFVQSCKRRIIPWLLRYLTPYYKLRRIYDRSLFKVVARHLGMGIVEWNRYPSEKQVQQYIQDYFRGHRKITCLSDII